MNIALPPEETEEYLLTPALMASIEDYTPHKEWLVVAAYVLRAAGSDNQDYFWANEAGAQLSPFEEAVREVWVALGYYDNQISAFFREEYRVPTDMSYALESSARGLFKAIFEYYQGVVAKIESFAKVGFFRHYPSLEEATPRFAAYAWSSAYPPVREFAHHAVIDYHIRTGLEIPPLTQSTGNESFDLDPKHVRDAVLAHLLEFFSVYPSKQWGEWDPRVTATKKCLHHGAFAWMNGGYVCHECHETLTEDEAHNLFYGAHPGMY